MIGYLVRGSRTNHVSVDLRVQGSAKISCPVCHVDTEHALLEGRLKMCMGCREVTIRPGGGRRFPRLFPPMDRDPADRDELFP